MAYSAWASSTAYVVGDIVRASSLPGTGLVFKCIVAGTSAATEPTWPTVIYTTQTVDGTQSNKVGFVVDGTVTWAAIMAVSQDLQSAALSSIIELFELQLDATLHGGSDIYRFHAGANALNTPGDVIWNGNSYLRYPVQVEGFEWNGQGQLPRPKLSISNLASTISALLLIVNEETPNNDLIGAKLTRIRTLARYLDNVNFEGGVNPSGAVDPTAEFPRDIYYIARKSAENRNVVEFECAAAFDLQHVKRAFDVSRRTLFTGMGHREQAQLTTPRKDARELFGRMTALAAVKPHPHKMIAIGQRLLKRVKRGLFAQVTQEAQDEVRRDTKFRMGPVTRMRQPFNDGGHGHTALGVSLRIEKDLGVNHVVCSRAFKIGPSHVKEVLFLDQHTGAGVINVQKALQIGERIGGAKRVHAGVRQGHPISLRKLENQLRLQGALNVQMQFGFGHGTQQRRQSISRNAAEVQSHGLHPFRLTGPCLNTRRR